VGPQLLWKDGTDNESCENGSIDLFDIQSMEKSTAVQMQNYPFAMPGNCFFVRKSDGRDFAFEADSDEEARRFIHGLRWLVARLAFNLIFGNRDVSCELVTLHADEKGMSPHSTVEDGHYSNKAMNDVTNHLVERVEYHTMAM